MLCGLSWASQSQETYSALSLILNHILKLPLTSQTEGESCSEHDRQAAGISVYAVYIYYNIIRRPESVDFADKVLII